MLALLLAILAVHGARERTLCRSVAPARAWRRHRRSPSGQRLAALTRAGAGRVVRPGRVYKDRWAR
jgi:hypothetical protein